MLVKMNTNFLPVISPPPSNTRLWLLQNTKIAGQYLFTSSLPLLSSGSKYKDKWPAHLILSCLRDLWWLRQALCVVQTTFIFSNCYLSMDKKLLILYPDVWKWYSNTAIIWIFRNYVQLVWDIVIFTEFWSNINQKKTWMY